MTYRLESCWIGSKKLCRYADERDQHADRHVAVDRLVAAVEQDHGGSDGREQLDAGEVGGVQVDRRHVGRPVLLVQLGEALDVTGLLAEGPHDPHSGERLLQVRGDVRDLLPHPPVGACGLVAEDHAAEEQQREGRHERDHRQVRVEQEQDHVTPTSVSVAEPA